ncbi:DEAD/DEAH box helicase [Olivibacter sp. XZL3]|uniref:DEAD/DEAH box helicase n=1 Tax=Olivibacter sp. XZL3 TaxID=1735116 RepID=UPI001066A81E|nr:DEAD/DEAH box helicase [Olivibacter sp. XZL3]
MANRHEVWLEGLHLVHLSEAFLMELAEENITLGPSDYQFIQAEELTLGKGVFFNALDKPDFSKIQVTQSTEGLLIGSDLDGREGRLNREELLALLAIAKKADFRAFFDEQLRARLFKEKAADYGLEKEPDLDRFFKLDYQEGLRIIPKLSALVPLREQDLQEWSEWLEPSVTNPALNPQTDQQIILVLKRHKYYRHLMIGLYQASATKTGKIKNPLKELSPLEQLWTLEGQQYGRFFSAIQRFQATITEKPQQQLDVEALKAIVQNPFHYPVFYHNEERSEKINAATLVPIQLALLPKTVKATINRKPPFYELGGSLLVDDVVYPLNGLTLYYGYFLRIEDTLYLIDHPPVLGLLRLLRDKPANLLIHEQKYPAFRKQVLSKLEAGLEVQYVYAQQAAVSQLNAFGIEEEKLIYLAEFGNFVTITPVMRYGEAEVPIRTKRQIHLEDGQGNVFLVKRNERVENDFMSLLLRQHPFFEEQQDSEFEYLYLHRKHFLDENWFLDVFDSWFTEGITVYGFNDLEGNRMQPYRPKISIHILSGMDWFNMKLSVTYGQKKASLRRLYATLRDKRKYIRLDDGTLGTLPEEWISKFNTYFNIGAILDEDTLGISKSNFSLIQELFDEEVLDDAVKVEIREYEEKLKKYRTMERIPVPAGLKVELREYQKEGLAWLNVLDEFGLGGCLADDMGLGKTVQIIAFMLAQRRKKGAVCHLLVVPTTLLFHWQKELAGYAPDLKVLLYYTTGRNKDESTFQDYDVVLTTYGVLVSDIPVLKKYTFNGIFLDESQQIKNPESQRYKAARLLKGRNRIAITGTPLENNVFDIYAQLSFACPGFLGNAKYFKDVYLRPIDMFHDQTRLRQLQQKVRPFILRRTKREVAKELPEKTEMVLYCEMGATQRQIYLAYEKEFREYISATSQEELKKSSMNVLRGLTRLRQICDSPVLLGEGRLPGDDSIKLDTLVAQIEENVPDHKILVFSQFVSMLDLIRKELDKRLIGYSYLTGGIRNRKDVVDSFQSDPDKRVFLISLKAGGTGLNLTQADYVYLIDPWWNPAVENQAIDRVHRLGQDKKVVAVRLVCSGTVEEKMIKLQSSKKALFHKLIRQGNAFMEEGFSKEALLELLRPL